MPKAIIGIDFDNTIVSYDRVFHVVAVERGLVPPSLTPTKQHVRDHLRLTGREDVWTELQGYVYGARMADAEMFPGVREFILRCRVAGVQTRVISHKTRFPYAGERYDLHEAALAWLELQGFLDPARIGLARGQVYFELTKADKLRRIEQAGCTAFVDDLPEFLAEANFPPGVQRILFDPHRAHAPDRRWRRANAWADVDSLLSPPVASPAVGTRRAL